MIATARTQLTRFDPLARSTPRARIQARYVHEGVTVSYFTAEVMLTVAVKLISLPS